MVELYKIIKKRKEQKSLLEKKGYSNYEFGYIGILSLLLVGNIITILLLMRAYRHYGIDIAQVYDYHIYTTTIFFIILFFVIQVKKIKNYGKEKKRLLVGMLIGIPAFIGGAALALMFY